MNFNSIHQDEYIKIFISDNKKVVFVKRLEKTNMLMDEKYKETIKPWIKINEKYKPEITIIDERQMHFIIGSELQQWLQKNLITPAIKNGLKKK